PGKIRMNGESRLSLHPLLADPEGLRARLRPVAGRHRKERIFYFLCLAVSGMAVLILAALFGAITLMGIATFSWKFLTAPPSPAAEESGMYPAIMGSVWVVLLAMLTALPLGTASAILLEEYRPRSPLMRRIQHIIELNITNLAGVPSVVYGILGLTVFVYMFPLFDGTGKPVREWGVVYYDQFYNEADTVLLVPVNTLDAPPVQPKTGMLAFDADFHPVNLQVIGEDDPWPEDPERARVTLRETDMGGRISEKTWYYFCLPFGRGVLAGALTLGLVILPTIIIAAREALRAVPDSLREGAFALGASRWQTIYRVTLPAALPGIMTGSILAMSRAIGEAAPLIMISGIVFLTNPPRHLMDDFTVMPLQIFNWAQRPQTDFHALAASGIIVLLAILLVFNSIALLIRQRYQKPLS
ncbi:MAG TPA: PstA family ABC transporter permease, partial [Candidatus Hydrogenedentes bacterium]|nr:PstA family ABC transporter permease [Candidatus Hydrogenedentota bacterium]